MGASVANRSSQVFGEGASSMRAFVLRLVGPVVVIALVSLGVAFPTAPAIASEGCENEARRVEQGSTFLPDCRAYELVSQPSQPSPASDSYYNGFPNSKFTGLSEPRNMPEVQFPSFAHDGNAVLFGSSQPNAESDSINGNLARRISTGWVGENIIPPVSRHGFLCDPNQYVGASADFEGILVNMGLSEIGAEERFPPEDCSYPEPPIAPGESTESANLFLRDTASKSFQLINPTPPGVTAYDPHLADVSADGSTVIFQSRGILTPEAPDGESIDHGVNEGRCESEYGDLYIWRAGTVRLLTVLPDGTAARGTLAGAHPYVCGVLPNQNGSFTYSVSGNGERALFYAGGGFKFEGGLNFPEEVRVYAPYVNGSLYLREHPGAEQSALGECTEAEERTEPGKACTVQIDTPEGGSGSAGGGQFQWASADTSKIFFTDEEKLTPDASAEAGKPDLYEYDVERPAGQRLTDLTASASEPADVLGVGGASEDGAYVYFVADGVLAANENSRNAKAQAGEANLYVRHAGATTFITALNAEGGDRCDWTAWCLTSRVSANGQYIAFDSIDSLTGYDNRPLRPEACAHLTEVAESPCIEAFRYAVAGGAHGELTCATCNPSGARPASEFAWSVIPAVNDEGYQGMARPMRLGGAMSDSGEVFFETMEKLASADENETWDVYEYSGGEGPSAQLHLISSGASELPSYIVGSTADGNNIFFVTNQSLLHADDRSDYDLYDARVGGGFVSQSEAIQPPSCGAVEACRSPLSEPPAEFSAGSSALFGSGNLVVPPPVAEPPTGKKHAKKPTRKQKLERAVRACKKRYGHKPGRRHACERQARKRYGANHRRAGK